MGLFSKNKKLAVEARHDSRVEVVAHQNATQEAKKKVDETNRNLKHLLDENGITLTIYLAAGHTLQKQKTLKGRK